MNTKNNKGLQRKNLVKRMASLFASAMMAVTLCAPLDMGTQEDQTLTVSAAANPYSKDYNIVAGVNYATRWAYASNNQYKHINKWAQPNCASFVSECLTAAGVKIKQAKRYGAFGHYKYYNTEWSVASTQFTYLKNQGYAYERATDKTIHIGDVVYYDWKNGNSTAVDHAAYCIGVNSAGEPIIAEHSDGNIRVWDVTNSKRRNVWVVHMTNAVGHVDVTNQYYNQSINIKSSKNKRYVSSDTDVASATDTIAIANRTAVNGWEKFNVVKNYSITSKKGTTPAISLKTYSDRYLSAYISDSSGGAPLKNTKNNSTWEAFRIFRNGNTEYIMSMINGKFVQVRDNNKLYAAGEGGWSWEGFDININSSVKTYKIKSSSGANVRSETKINPNNIVGALAKGSVIYYDKTKKANGYTWYHITSVKTNKSGSWGKFNGYWVAGV